MKTTESIRIGTASWSDPGFAAYWYPEGMKPEDRLSWYAERFDLVEVNTTFYHVPSSYMTAKWVERTPENFLFDVKLFKYFSMHSTPPASLPKNLRDVLPVSRGRIPWNTALIEPLAGLFLQGIEPLKRAGKLGALLLQMTPSFSPASHDLRELDPLLNLFSDERVALELRHRAWFTEHATDVFSFCATRGVSLVLVDAPRGEHFMLLPPSNFIPQPELAYLRAHGRNLEGFTHGRSVAERFDYDYSDEEITEIADRVQRLQDAANEVHVVFNNNNRDYAPRAAGRLRQVLSVPEVAPVAMKVPA